MSISPRDLTPCCEDHRTKDSVWVMDRIRRDLDIDIIEMMWDREELVTQLD
jgi:hypothetical protein